MRSMVFIPHQNRKVPIGQASGFTLIELVVVMILVGVLSVVAAVRFQDKTGYAEYAYRDRFINSLRNIQVRAMQDSRAGFCFRLNIATGSASAYGPPSLDYSPGNQAATCASGVSSSELLTVTNAQLLKDDIEIALSDGTSTSISYIGFDSLGNALTSVANCRFGCKVTFSGEGSASVCVNTEGYIYAC